MTRWWKTFLCMWTVHDPHVFSAIHIRQIKNHLARDRELSRHTKCDPTEKSVMKTVHCRGERCLSWKGEETDVSPFSESNRTRALCLKNRLFIVSARALRNTRSCIWFSSRHLSVTSLLVASRSSLNLASEWCALATMNYIDYMMKSLLWSLIFHAH